MSDETTPAPGPAPASNLPVPRSGSGTAPAATDGDNRYKAVQQKLKALAGALDGAVDRLGRLNRQTRSDADRAKSLATKIANADLDPIFVEMTNAVSLALGGASTEVNRLVQTAQGVALLAEETRVGHAKYYAALDEVRTGRKFRTPKPGFFNN